MKRKPIITAGIFLIGAAFFIIGIARGESGIVLNKAIRVCLECIGLG
jgi:hypothetical protein